MALEQWALPQLAKLLPIDEDSLKQIIAYTDTLSRQAAADHLRDILGDSPQALEFITSFQQRRPKPPAEASPIVPASNSSSRNASDAEVPRPSARPKKKKAPLHQLPARQIESHGDAVGGYRKQEQADYMASSNRHKLKEPPLSNTLALQAKPDMVSAPTTRQPSNSTAATQTLPKSKLPPGSTGPLISDSLTLTSRSSSPSSSTHRNKTSNTSTKINLTGGTSMRGASTTLSDLDSAIRSLEATTNPSLLTEKDNEARRCNCMAQRHPLLTAAPNCLNCGKIVCAKEGLGPCTFCGNPLLKGEDVQAMLHSLRAERGRERQAVGNASHKKAEVAKAPRPFSGTSTPMSGPVSGEATPPQTQTQTDTEDEEEAALALARKHRDRLLAFQQHNAQRTRITDEAADYATPDTGLSQWASPQERALQLKKQQKVLREQEWAARPEWEKRKMVVSLDIDARGKAKATRSFMREERPRHVEEGGLDDDELDEEALPQRERDGNSRGTFARNPLMGGLIRPTFTPKDGGGDGNGKEKEREKKSTWRRVQDDFDDNEHLILDGGAYAGRIDGRVLGGEEQAVG